LVLVDSSVWIDHLRNGNETLERQLHALQVATHHFIVGELALGSLRARMTILEALGNLPQIVRARDEEVLRFVEDRKLYGTGIGYVDAHLLTSVALTPGTQLWTLDKRLRGVAGKLGLEWNA